MPILQKPPVLSTELGFVPFWTGFKPDLDRPDQWHGQWLWTSIIHYPSGRRRLQYWYAACVADVRSGPRAGQQAKQGGLRTVHALCERNSHGLFFSSLDSPRGRPITRIVWLAWGYVDPSLYDADPTFLRRTRDAPSKT